MQATTRGPTTRSGSRRKPAERMPNAQGVVARLAYARARSAGVDLAPLLRKARLTAAQLENPRSPIKVRDQIDFLNLVAAALDDDFLGARLALLLDVREAGLLYYVTASSGTLTRRCSAPRATARSSTKASRSASSMASMSALRSSIAASAGTTIGTRSSSW